MTSINELNAVIREQARIRSDLLAIQDHNGWVWRGDVLKILRNETVPAVQETPATAQGEMVQ